MKNYLVNIELPTSGLQKSAKDYKADLVSKGYTLRQAIGSLGGSSGRSTTITGGMVKKN